MERRRYGPFILVLQKRKSSSTDWLFATSGPLPSKHTQPFSSHPLTCHQATVALSTQGPGLSCGFIIDCDGKQNHHRIKARENGGKNANKIHADLQIEKVREREEEDSPLTKPCAHKIQHHPCNERQKKKEKKRHKLEKITERERTNRPVIIFAGIWG